MAALLRLAVVKQVVVTGTQHRGVCDGSAIVTPDGLSWRFHRADLGPCACACACACAFACAYACACACACVYACASACACASRRPRDVMHRAVPAERVGNLVGRPSAALYRLPTCRRPCLVQSLCPPMPWDSTQAPPPPPPCRSLLQHSWPPTPRLRQLAVPPPHQVVGRVGVGGPYSPLTGHQCVGATQVACRVRCPLASTEEGLAPPPASQPVSFRTRVVGVLVSTTARVIPPSVTFRSGQPLQARGYGQLPQVAAAHSTRLTQAAGTWQRDRLPNYA